VDVYFDDVTMTYTPGNIIQYNEYYPFGLQTATSWTRENNTGNNFLYNGGTELNTTTGVMDLFYRNYDPALGRMNQVDPMASKYASSTPYNYAFNSPVVLNDPQGDDAWYTSTALYNFVMRFYYKAGGGGKRTAGGSGTPIMDNGVAGRPESRQNGFTWSASTGQYSWFKTGAEAMRYAVSYNDRFNSWSNTDFMDRDRTIAMYDLHTDLLAGKFPTTVSIGWPDLQSGQREYSQKTQKVRLNAGVGLLLNEQDGRVINTSPSYYSMDLTVSVFKAGVFDKNGNLSYVWRAKVDAVSFVSGAPNGLISKGEVKLVKDGETIGTYSLMPPTGPLLPPLSGQYSYVGEKYIDLPNTNGNVQIQFFGSWAVDYMQQRTVPTSISQPTGLSVSGTVSLD
jgi:RHS repeat-associated protein